MSENFNLKDPFEWDEPEPKPETFTRWQKFKYKTIGYILLFMFRGVDQAIKEKEHRKKHYRHVIKQGWFGEYSEWHER